MGEKRINIHPFSLKTRIVSGDVRVSYCNSISAWVTFRDRGEAQEAIAGLIKSKKETSVRKPYKIITWSEFSQRNSTGERRSNNPSNNPHGLFARSNQKSRVNNLPGRSATKSNENNSLVSNDQSETILAQKTLD